MNARISFSLVAAPLTLSLTLSSPLLSRGSSTHALSHALFPSSLSWQLRRVASAERAIDIKYLCVHLKKWEILHTRGVDLNGLMIILLFAKHRDPELIKMELKKQPMEVREQRCRPSRVSLRPRV